MSQPMHHSTLSCPVAARPSSAATRFRDRWRLLIFTEDAEHKMSPRSEPRHHKLLHPIIKLWLLMNLEVAQPDLKLRGVLK